MAANILTWIGAVLGIAVLLVMAFGTFVLDFHDVLTDRRERRHDAHASRPSSSSALT